MIIAVVVAVAASIAYGVSDVVTGVAVRRHATAALALWAQATGLIVLGAAALLRRPDAAPAALAWGAAGGVVGALAVLAFYTALQRGSTSLVTPIAGSGVVLPVLAGLVRGDPVGWQVGTGVAATILGILIVVSTSGEADAPPATTGRPDSATGAPGRAQAAAVHDGCVPRNPSRSGRTVVALAVAAAAGFGSFFVIVDEASAAAPPGVGALDTALAVALAVQVGALVVTAIAATRHTRICLQPERALLLPATLVGLLDVVGDMLVTLAIGLGPLAVVGPLGSLDPVVAVLIATFVLRERLRPVPLVGVVVALAGIVLITTG